MFKTDVDRYWLSRVKTVNSSPPRRVFTILFLCGLSLFPSLPAMSQSTGGVVREFCTDAGPVTLTIDGESVTGRYRITVSPQPKDGTIKGTLKEGLLDGVWADPDGKGRIIFGFASDFSRFTAIYNNRDKSPSHWFEGWMGISKTKIGDVPVERRQSLRCEY
jgi:hypothetical protein